MVFANETKIPQNYGIRKNDLQYYFKGLAAPEVANETADGDGRDPFAAPEEDGRGRF